MLAFMLQNIKADSLFHDHLPCLSLIKYRINTGINTISYILDSESKRAKIKDKKQKVQ